MSYFPVYTSEIRASLTLHSKPSGWQLYFRLAVVIISVSVMGCRSVLGQAETTTISNDGSSATPINSNVDETEALSSAVPANTNTPEPSPTSDAELTPTSISTLSNNEREHANLVLGLGTPYYPLSFCLKDVIPGKIIYTKYPYSHFLTIAEDPQIGYYAPQWSPDGNWIAYIAVQPTKPTENVFQDSIELRYADSDTLWITDATGAQHRQLGEPLDRYESLGTRGDCSAFGLIGLEGWSADSTWIAFLYINISEHTSESKAANIVSGEIQDIGERLNGLAWSPVGSRLATINNKDQRVEIMDLGSPDRETVSFTYPSTADGELSFINLGWVEDMSALILLADGRAYLSPKVIWRLSIVDGAWQELIEIEQEGYLKRQVFDNFFLRCAIEDGKRFISIIEVDTLDEKDRIFNDGAIRCGTLAMIQYQEGATYLSFIGDMNSEDSLSRVNLWLVALVSNDLVPRPVLSYETLASFDDYQIVDYSWRPILEGVE